MPGVYSSGPRSWAVAAFVVAAVRCCGESSRAAHGPAVRLPMSVPPLGGGFGVAEGDALDCSASAAVETFTAAASGGGGLPDAPGTFERARRRPACLAPALPGGAPSASRRTGSVGPRPGAPNAGRPPKKYAVLRAENTALSRQIKWLKREKRRVEDELEAVKTDQAAQTAAFEAKHRKEIDSSSTAAAARDRAHPRDTGGARPRGVARAPQAQFPREETPAVPEGLRKVPYWERRFTPEHGGALHPTVGPPAASPWPAPVVLGSLTAPCTCTRWNAPRFIWPRGGG